MQYQQVCLSHRLPVPTSDTGVLSCIHKKTYNACPCSLETRLVFFTNKHSYREMFLEGTTSLYTEGSKSNTPCCALLARQVRETFAWYAGYMMHIVYANSARNICARWKRWYIIVAQRVASQQSGFQNSLRHVYLNISPSSQMRSIFLQHWAKQFLFNLNLKHHVSGWFLGRLFRYTRCLSIFPERHDRFPMEPNDYHPSPWIFTANELSFHSALPCSSWKLP
jgi:hypothetical protein